MVRATLSGQAPNAIPKLGGRITTPLEGKSGPSMPKQLSKSSTATNPSTSSRASRSRTFHGWFSDSLNYLDSDQGQFELWTLEVRRLVGIINANKPIDLEGLDDWFGVADREGYQRLDKLGTQLTHASSISILDNELLRLGFGPAMGNLSHVQASTRRLLHSFGPEGAVHTARGSILLETENDRRYQSLINYVTGIWLKFYSER